MNNRNSNQNQQQNFSRQQVPQQSQNMMSNAQRAMYQGSQQQPPSRVSQQQQQPQQFQYQQQAPNNFNYNSNNNNFMQQQNYQMQQPQLLIQQPQMFNQPFSNFNMPVQQNPSRLLEDEIQEKVKQNTNSQNKIEYDLEKGLSLDVKTLQKHFKFNSDQNQTIPIMVSVKTQDQTSDLEIENNILESRPNIDLICVIDNSGSMQGTKIQNVQQTLLQLVEMLQENDRISLVTFNSYSTVLCNFKKIDQKNKSDLTSIIQSIYATGGTDITSGIKSAFDLLKERKHQNPVSSIFLLSDGQDQSSDQKIRQLLNTSYQSLQENCFTIHSFGFGQDHDATLMTNIAQIKDGSFYYVEKLDQVDEFFIDALGGLFSVVAQDIQIEITINRQDELFNKFFKDAFISKTYGNMWKVTKTQQNEILNIKINQLFSGVSKDYIFELTVPKSNIQSLQDFERNVEMIKVQLTALPVDIKYSTKVLKDNKLIFTLFTCNEQVPQDSEINDNVEFNYLRVKAAQAMEEAMKFADKQQYDQGQQVLSDMLVRIDKSHQNNKEKLQIIKQDIIQCQQNAKPQIYEQQGRLNLQQNCNNNYNQQSYANRSTDIYQNNCQRMMVQQQQAFKMNSNNNYRN